MIYQGPVDGTRRHLDPDRRAVGRHERGRRNRDRHHGRGHDPPQHHGRPGRRQLRSPRTGRHDPGRQRLHLQYRHPAIHAAQHQRQLRQPHLGLRHLGERRRQHVLHAGRRNQGRGRAERRVPRELRFPQRRLLRPHLLHRQQPARRHHALREHHGGSRRLQPGGDDRQRSGLRLRQRQCRRLVRPGHLDRSRPAGQQPDDGQHCLSERHRRHLQHHGRQHRRHLPGRRRPVPCRCRRRTDHAGGVARLRLFADGRSAASAITITGSAAAGNVLGGSIGNDSFVGTSSLVQPDTIFTGGGTDTITLAAGHSARGPHRAVRRQQPHQRGGAHAGRPGRCGGGQRRERRRHPAARLVGPGDGPVGRPGVGRHDQCRAGHRHQPGHVDGRQFRDRPVGHAGRYDRHLARRLQRPRAQLRAARRRRPGLRC